ncbi:hypothetical protein CK203_043756 [Vitis vinifera]|uniref:Uncharacterized protein n=1 Tax=Vitis vinifera TaxID=29760 RepID=A0A438HW23_VITVI|nr:hypothetical protein CK203_043756 [Vitis vinifera]
MSDCELAFKEIKCYLTQPPILSSLQLGEQLYIYLAISDCAVSAVLFRYVKDKEQRLVYYLSQEGVWILHVDEASRVFGFGMGLLLQSPTGEQLEQAILLEFPVSNKEAEYEAILAGLNLFLTLSTSKIEICNDSQLVVGQIQREYEAKDERMARYLSKVQVTLDRLSKSAIKRIPHTKNVQANALARIVATLPIKEAILMPVYLQATSLIVIATICNTSETGVGWMHEIQMYLRIGDLLEESKQAHKMRIQVGRFTLIGDSLYRRSFKGPYLRDIIGLPCDKAPRIMPKDVIGAKGTTYFALANGMDAVIPTEIGNAAIRMASYQYRAIAHYNKKARLRMFRVETLVLKRVFENTAEKRVGKLQANWEEPYVVSKARNSEAYHLQTLNETPCSAIGMYLT